MVNAAVTRYGMCISKPVLSLHTWAHRVVDTKVDITWRGYSTRIFSVYCKENLNLRIISSKIRAHRWYIPPSVALYWDVLRWQAWSSEPSHSNPANRQHQVPIKQTDNTRCQSNKQTTPGVNQTNNTRCQSNRQHQVSIKQTNNTRCQSIKQTKQANS